MTINYTDSSYDLASHLRNIGAIEGFSMDHNAEHPIIELVSFGRDRLTMISTELTEDGSEHLTYTAYDPSDVNLLEPIAMGGVPIADAIRELLTVV